MIRPEFPLRRFGRGYLRQDVDAFVERLLATVSRRPIARPVTHDEFQRLRFRTTFSGGYSAGEVDAFLKRAEAWLPADDGPVAGFPRPRFDLARFREGYDPVEVDALVDRIMATVEGRPVDRPVTDAELREVTFTPVRFREGYDVEEVDAFLEQAQAWLPDR
jgi:DivIVA domain-containing protein